MRLSVCVFDKNCEEYPVAVIQVPRNYPDIFNILNAMRKNARLRRILHSQGFWIGNACDYSFQVDSREGVIRLRDKEDNVDEPGNIAMMFNLHLCR